jgi:hypothetical protein
VLLAYVLLLLGSAVLLSIAAARGSGQHTGARVLNGVLAAVFLCYAIYLALFFGGGTVYLSSWVLVLPAVAIFRSIRARRAAKSVTPYEYPDVYAQPGQQWGGAVAPPASAWNDFRPPAAGPSELAWNDFRPRAASPSVPAWNDFRPPAVAPSVPAARETATPWQPQPWSAPQDSAHPWVEVKAYGHAAPSGLPGPGAVPAPRDRSTGPGRHHAPEFGTAQPPALPQPIPREWPPAAGTTSRT